MFPIHRTILLTTFAILTPFVLLTLLFTLFSLPVPIPFPSTFKSMTPTLWTLSPGHSLRHFICGRGFGINVTGNGANAIRTAEHPNTESHSGTAFTTDSFAEPMATMEKTVVKKETVMRESKAQTEIRTVTVAPKPKGTLDPALEQALEEDGTRELDEQHQPVPRPVSGPKLQERRLSIETLSTDAPSITKVTLTLTAETPSYTTLTATFADPYFPKILPLVFMEAIAAHEVEKVGMNDVKVGMPNPPLTTRAWVWEDPDPDDGMKRKGRRQMEWSSNSVWLTAAEATLTPIVFDKVVMRDLEREAAKAVPAVQVPTLTTMKTSVMPRSVNLDQRQPVGDRTDDWPVLTSTPTRTRSRQSSKTRIDILCTTDIVTVEARTIAGAAEVTESPAPPLNGEGERRRFHLASDKEIEAEPKKLEPDARAAAYASPLSLPNDHGDVNTAPVEPVSKNPHISAQTAAFLPVHHNSKIDTRWPGLGPKVDNLVTAPRPTSTGHWKGIGGEKGVVWSVEYVPIQDTRWRGLGPQMDSEETAPRTTGHWKGLGDAEGVEWNMGGEVLTKTRVPWVG
ncbi:MAG: hypothetical protein M1827_005134 [Pycnora praestabilis]|nr:MAG: hypothetical protein M1827_005134 [Pycnora praestabilis]